MAYHPFPIGPKKDGELDHLNRLFKQAGARRVGTTWRPCLLHGPEIPSVYACPECSRALRDTLNSAIQVMRDFAMLRNKGAKARIRQWLIDNVGEDYMFDAADKKEGGTKQ